MSAPRINFEQFRGFPSEFSKDSKIETLTFLESSREVIRIMECFGTLFTPVVSDMRGNVDQLNSHYEKDVETRKFLEDMVVSDLKKECHSWLLWLKRALELIERFFFHVLNDAKVINGESDNLRPMINEAYNEVLKPYHGFFLQNTFKLLYRCLPSGKVLLGTGPHFEDNIKHLKKMLPNMRMHIDKINKLYDDNNLNDLRKV